MWTLAPFVALGLSTPPTDVLLWLRSEEPPVALVEGITDALGPRLASTDGSEFLSCSPERRLACWTALARPALEDYRNLPFATPISVGGFRRWESDHGYTSPRYLWIVTRFSDGRTTSMVLDLDVAASVVVSWDFAAVPQPDLLEDRLFADATQAHDWLDVPNTSSDGRRITNEVFAFLPAASRATTPASADEEATPSAVRTDRNEPRWRSAPVFIVGAALLAGGIGTMIGAALAADGTVPTVCGDDGTCQQGTNTPTLGAGGPATLSLGVGLAVTGTTWMVGSAAFERSAPLPWWTLLSGLALGGIGFGVSEAVRP